MESPKNMPIDVSGIPSPILKFAKRFYDSFVRHHLPRKILVLNGIPVKSGRLLDATDSYPNYEEACLSTLRTHVSKNDDVTIIGGGLGVSSVVCAREGSTATVYEAAAEKCNRIKETAWLNQVAERVNIERGIVGKEVDVFGTPVDRVVNPANLDPCDVLELDCEGAELEILSELSFNPRVIVVEVHPNLGVSESDVRSLLAEKGYDIREAGTHDSETGIVILEAVKE